MDRYPNGNISLPDLTEVAIKREILMSAVIGSSAIAAEIELVTNPLPAPAYECQDEYKQAAAEFGSSLLFQSIDEASAEPLTAEIVIAAKQQGLAAMSVFIEEETVCRWKVYNELLVTAGAKPYKCQRGVIRPKRLVSPGYDSTHLLSKWHEDVTILAESPETPRQVAENIAHAGYLGIKSTLQFQVSAEENYLSRVLAKI